MEQKFFSDPQNTMTVSVDGYEEGVVSGRLYAGTEEAEAFHGLLPLLMRMEGILREAETPMEAQERRSFAPVVYPKGKLGRPGGTRQPGRLATLQIQVRYRQNSSWQGSALWQEERREQPFRSALELVTLLYSILEQKNDET